MRSSVNLWGELWFEILSKYINLFLTFFDLPFTHVILSKSVNIGLTLEITFQFLRNLIFAWNLPSLGVRVAALSPLAVTGTEESGNNMTIRRYTHLLQVEEKKNIWSICCSFICFLIAVIFSLKETVWLTRGCTNTCPAFLWACKIFSVQVQVHAH